MSYIIATHDGPFHADDVLSAAMIRVFVNQDATIIRTRDSTKLSQADVVFDVGGVYDPKSFRFDHHQRSYQGCRSSAGMVLDWLAQSKQVSPPLVRILRAEIVDYVDAVDIGDRSSDEGVPCFSTMIGLLVEGAEEENFNSSFEQATQWAMGILKGLMKGYERSVQAEEEVLSAMQLATKTKCRVLFFDRYIKWKPAYFAAQGAHHETEYVVFPGKNDWRVVTIPVSSDNRRDKRKLPEEWAGLEGEMLSDVVGVAGARFCHKNCFIAVFDTKENLLQALEQWKRLHH